MASPSYFDLPLQPKATAAAAVLRENEAEGWTQSSLLSPQITQILDELDLEDRSSSSEEGSLSEENVQPMHSSKNVQHRSHKDKQAINTKKDASSSHSPKKSPSNSHSKPSSVHVTRAATLPASGRKSAAAQHPHLPRFHSLRSMLFSSKIEQDIMKVQREENIREEAALKWRGQHDQRQIGKPRTPEKELKPKDGLSRKITNKLKRIASKEEPAMKRINEGVDGIDGRESTASSDNEDERTEFVRKRRESDEASIDHSDLDELVRWVSRRDPPSDGEARKGVKLDPTVSDSAHESLGDSDVDELVRWTSKRSKPGEIQQTPSEQAHSGYSDASTEDDSEVNNGSSDDEDADELVRWVSRREGPNAGPVRQKTNLTSIDLDSDVSEIDRWKSRNDGTSGESNPASGYATPALLEEDLLEPARGRSRERPSEEKMKRHLTHEDVNELVQWVSRKDSKQQDTLEGDDRALELLQREEKQTKQIGMTLDEGSLSHGDIEGLVRFVSKA